MARGGRSDGTFFAPPSSYRSPKVPATVASDVAVGSGRARRPVPRRQRLQRGLEGVGTVCTVIDVIYVIGPVHPIAIPRLAQGDHFAAQAPRERVPGPARMDLAHGAAEEDSSEISNCVVAAVLRVRPTDVARTSAVVHDPGSSSSRTDAFITIPVPFTCSTCAT